MDQKEVIRLCKELGCCDACSLRYIGIKHPNAYGDSKAFIQKYLDTPSASSTHEQAVVVNDTQEDPLSMVIDSISPEIETIVQSKVKSVENDSQEAKIVKSKEDYTVAVTVVKTENNEYEIESVATTIPETDRNDGITEPQAKRIKFEICVCCLGILQEMTWQQSLEMVKEQIDKKRYDCDTFACALSMPYSTMLREKAITLYLQSILPNYNASILTSLKEAWKWSFGVKMESHIGYTLISGSNSPLLITVVMEYPDEFTELNVVKSLAPKNFPMRPQPNNRVSMEMSRRAVQTALDVASLENLELMGWKPVAAVNTAAHCASVASVCEPVYLAGRYIKLSRTLPQTPWMVAGERMMESSVQETICEPVAKLCNETQTRRRVSYTQLLHLWGFLNDHREIAFGFNKSAQARHYSKRMWKRVSAICNSVGEGSLKTGPEWCKYWVDYKAKLRKKYRTFNDSSGQSGGDPPIESVFSEIERKFLKLIGEDLSLRLPGKQVDPLAMDDEQERQDTQSPRAYDLAIFDQEVYQEANQEVYQEAIQGVNQEANQVNQEANQKFDQEANQVNQEANQKFDQEANRFNQEANQKFDQEANRVNQEANQKVNQEANQKVKQEANRVNQEANQQANQEVNQDNHDANDPTQHPDPSARTVNHAPVSPTVRRRQRRARQRRLTAADAREKLVAAAEARAQAELSNSHTLKEAVQVLGAIVESLRRIEARMAAEEMEFRMKFMSAGREDVDVRCLGEGRPFAVEIADPRRLLNAEELKQVCEEVSSGGKVVVKELVYVTKEDLTTLKKGEETKTKTYQALCIKLSHTKEDQAEGTPEVTERDIANINSFRNTAEEGARIALQQKTPIRVLHRRPLLTRTRRILELEARRVPDQKQLFCVRLATDAGTYVKEWVHGELSRTVPSLSAALGADADILALDVAAIDLCWPPRAAKK